ncbi:acyl-CoA dehydrogenase family protein [Salinispora tropica]|uniref:Acyl-CoA dehydrogenase, type 2, C-terminal domain n=1 Tax=Salinispora tropica (strain ATCC BAA-916 / DSM 44818 / JCM 13857 / NBRC 105044 / CNB-440) TaxID=369723 RepID=A4X8G4_SALTO|nr:acyl-CoA dehydrogenase [Salinispora tropica]ABP55164.1 Acyl-CoA dehydrogenase, type 2, C-terminal domain [Salinispora tropica CNB-440]
MTVTRRVPGRAPTLPPEPDLTPAEVVARAEDIGPLLVERQGETEKRTYYAVDTHTTFKNAGFYRILVPRRYGGYEFGVDTFLRVVMALARGCPSTGWMYCLGATHALQVATLFDEKAQAELFRGGDFICPATIVPSGAAERAANGDWILNGTFPYCSGSPYATHFLGHTLPSQAEGEPPAPMLFVAPREEWRRLDDWGTQLGLKGSGSHSIHFENGRIAEHLTLPGTHMSEVDVSTTPGRQLHGNPEYGGGPLSFMLLEVSALAVGMAKGALDAYENLMRNRTTLFPPIVRRAESPDFQWWYGQAAGMIATAEAAVLQAIGQWSAQSARNVAGFSREEDLRLAAICREAIRLAWHAVESHLFPTAGSSSVRQGERIERVWRDMSTMHSHAGIGVLLASTATRELAQARFGVGER